MKSIRTQDAVGHALIHDLVRHFVVAMLLRKRIFRNY